MNSPMNELDLSAAVDLIFDSAKPGEILQQWQEWGCGRYAEAGEPYFVGPFEKPLPVKPSQPWPIFMEYTVHTYADSPVVPEALLVGNGGCSVLRFEPTVNHQELALAA